MATARRLLERNASLGSVGTSFSLPALKNQEVLYRFSFTSELYSRGSTSTRRMDGTGPATNSPGDRGLKISQLKTIESGGSPSGYRASTWECLLLALLFPWSHPAWPASPFSFFPLLPGWLSLVKRERRTGTCEQFWLGRSGTDRQNQIRRDLCPRT